MLDAQRHRPLPDAPTVCHVSDEDLGNSMRAYTGYFGTFSVDAVAQFGHLAGTRMISKGLSCAL